MADAADLGLAVKLPPRRAIAYFKAKGYTVSWNWWDTWGEAHAKSFTAAKADGAGAALAQLETALALPKRGWRRVETPGGLDDVIVHRDYLPHIVEKRADARERFAHYLIPTLQDPLEVWLTRYGDGSYRRRFIALFEETKRQSLVIARENRDGSLMFNFIPAERMNYLDNQRKGFLLYRREGR